MGIFLFYCQSFYSFIKDLARKLILLVLKMDKLTERIEALEDRDYRFKPLILVLDCPFQRGNMQPLHVSQKLENGHTPLGNFYWWYTREATGKGNQECTHTIRRPRHSKYKCSIIFMMQNSYNNYIIQGKEEFNIFEVTNIDDNNDDHGIVI